MALYCVMMKYTPEALNHIITTKEDRSIAARGAIESAGGKFHGVYGMLGPAHHIMVIAEMNEVSDLLSVLMRVIQGGAIADLKTIALYSGQDVVAGAEKAASLDYTPAQG